MSDFQKQKERLLKNPEIKKEYDELENEFQIASMLVEARSKASMSQKELSKVTGISQSNISRIETGVESPSIRTLQTIARGLGKTLTISIK